MADPDPDWYPDPGKTPGVFRWWTGAEWTDLLASDPDAPPPAAESIRRSVRPSGLVSPGHALRNTLIIAAVLAAVLTLCTLLGFQSAVAARYPEGQPSDLGTPKVLPPKVAFDEATRRATVRDQMSVTLPDKPFGEAWVSTHESEVMSGSVSVDVPVHKETDSTPGWYGTAMAGLLNPTLVVDGDQAATAENILKGFSETLYTDAPTELSELEPIDAPEGFEGFRAHIDYDVTGIPSTRDDIVIMVAPLADGEVGVWAELCPQDAPAKPRTQLEQARATLQLN